MKITALIAWLSLAASPLAAETRPTLVPQRDVTVQYSVHAEGRPPETMAVDFAGGGSHLRAAVGGLPGVMLLDRRTHELVLLLDPMRSYLILPGGGRDIDSFLLDERMSFSRTGSETIAGLRCTDWQVRSDRGVAAACVTPDGVILHAQGTDKHQRHGELTATSVRYGALPASLFLPPADYRRMDLPKEGLRALLPMMQVPQ